MEQRGILTRSPSHSWACVFWTKTFQSWELILVLWIFSKRKLNYIVMVWSRKQKSTKQLEQTNKQKYGITKDIERNKRPGDDKTIKNPNIYCISVFFFVVVFIRLRAFVRADEVKKSSQRAIPDCESVWWKINYWPISHSILILRMVHWIFN